MTLIEQLRDLRQQPQGPTYKGLSELCNQAANELERQAWRTDFSDVPRMGFLVWNGQRVSMAWWRNGLIDSNSETIDDATHWMPLPVPPELKD